jgi:hypothetical protein
MEQKMQEMESRHREELGTLREEKGSLQALVGKQSGVIRELETQLTRATGNSTAMQRQQQEMMDTVHNLISLCNKDGGIVAKGLVLTDFTLYCPPRRCLVGSCTLKRKVKTCACVLLQVQDV